MSLLPASLLQADSLPLGQLAGPRRDDPRPLVIYHGGGCPDGFAAALAAWEFYQGQAEFFACDHGDVKTMADLPEVAGRAVYILDFSFAEPILAAMDAVAARLTLLDHHKSAADVLGKFTCRCGALHFDLKKSGARLAWEYFLPGRHLPDLVRYVEDRDLWVWKHPHSAAYLAALDMEPQEFAHWSAIADNGPEQLAAFLARGQAMDDKFNKLAADMADSATEVVFNGARGLMVNAPNVFHSLIGNLLSQKSGSFALIWTVHKSGAIKVGLRSQKNFDCIPLAQSMGGGGHPQASAFRMDIEKLPELLRGRLNAP
jgi:oligoribonuclease NrnB/cAMP/cGMP phosphodiesterase (DHH superfamily)